MFLSSYLFIVAFYFYCLIVIIFFLYFYYVFISYSIMCFYCVFITCFISFFYVCVYSIYAWIEAQGKAHLLTHFRGPKQAQMRPFFFTPRQWKDQPRKARFFPMLARLAVVCFFFFLLQAYSS